MNLLFFYYVFDLKIVGELMKRIIFILMLMLCVGVKIEVFVDCEVCMI